MMQVGPIAENVMRKLMISVGAAAFLSSAAFAATADGVVREFIPETKVITLESKTSGVTLEAIISAS